MKKTKLLISFVLLMSLVFYTSLSVQSFDGNSAGKPASLTAGGAPVFVNVTYNGGLVNVDDALFDVNPNTPVDIWYYVVNGTPTDYGLNNDTYLEIQGGASGLTWSTDDGPYATFISNNGTHSFYKYTLTPTADTTEFKAYTSDGDWEVSSNHKVLTAKVGQPPVLLNVTRNSDGSALNVDDFGFDVSQYENVTFWYMVVNGSLNANYTELMGSFNGWSAPLYFTHVGNNGTVDFEIYKLEYNVTSVAVIEFKGRHSGDWANAEVVPGNLNHQIVVNGATIMRSLVVDAAGNVLTPVNHTDDITGKVFSTILTDNVTTVYLTVNVSNAKSNQIFGVGHSYLPLKGGSDYFNWDVTNGVFNSTLGSKYGTGTTNEAIEYWTVALQINESIKLEYKAMMQEGTGSVQYEPGLGPNNHALEFRLLNEPDRTTTVTVTDTVTNNVTTTVTNTVTETSNVTVTSVSTSVSVSVSKSVSVSVSVGQKASPGFGVAMVILVLAGLSGVIVLRKRK